jgi:hypothetical protein
MPYLRFFLSGRCVRAEPATLRTFFDLLVRRRSEAVLPTRFDVLSFLAMVGPSKRTVTPLTSAAANGRQQMRPPFYIVHWQLNLIEPVPRLARLHL